MYAQDSIDLLQNSGIQFKYKAKAFGAMSKLISVNEGTIKTRLTLVQQVFQIIGAVYRWEINVGRLLEDNTNVLIGTH